MDDKGAMFIFLIIVSIILLTLNAVSLFSCAFQ